VSRLGPYITSTDGAPRLRPIRIRVACLAFVATLVAVSVTACGNARGAGSPSPPFAAEPVPSGPSGEVSFASNIEMSCVEAYSAETLQHRDFAFAGTVVRIGDVPDDAGSASYVDVGFTVDHWFRGGSAATVTVAMLPPVATTSVDSTTYRIGSRLLVSGEPRWDGPPLHDPIAWACGFTRWYTEADRTDWERAFA